MNFQKHTLSILIVLLAFTTSKAQYITVDDTFTAQELVENVLINSPCANVSNFSVSGWDNSTNGNSYGYFTNGTSDFPFENGVLITTGRAVSAIGPNNSLLSEGPASWGGDADLEAAIGENNTINATVLEFDFLPLANKVSFEYIFSSEQYLSNPGSNQCNFSDGFAFLLREVNSQDQYENLAVVPGTTIPVKITTVRGATPNCPAANEIFFDAYNGIEHPTNYNGQTKILKAEANVTPGVLYHMKLVIADQGNQLYDSAIFLGGGSFKVEIDLGIDRLIETQNAICEEDVFQIDATQDGNNTYQWFKDGVLIPGATNPIYEANESGEYHVEIVLENTTCVADGSITLEFVPLPNLNDDASLTVCEFNGTGLGVFNLTSLDGYIKNFDTTLNPVIYFESETDAINENNAIQNPSQYQSDDAILYALVSNGFGCKSIVPVTIFVSLGSISAPQPFIFCDTDANQDGITTINLAQQITPIITVGLGADVSVLYFSSIVETSNNSNQLPNNFTNTIPNTQTIYALISENNDCLGIVPITIQIITFDPVLPTENLILCENSSITLQAGSGFSSYTWNTGATTPNITINAAGTYTVTVSNQNGCLATKSFVVTLIESPQIIDVITTNFTENNNSATITFTGNGDYLFSIDGINFQESNIFTGLPSGSYTAIIIDLRNCGVATKSFFILGYPKFFTPNGDGVNDVWQIPFLHNRNAKIVIFDRYGKILHVMAGNGFWDGTYNGSVLPSNDYWFELQLENQETIKGHFSLKR